MSQSPALVIASWDALFEAPARAALEHALPAYVMSKRWYRTKTKHVQSAHMIAAFPLFFAGQRARVTLVELRLEDGSRDTYVLPLSFVTGEEATRHALSRPHAVLMPVSVKSAVESSPGLVIDAVGQPGFLRELLAAIGRGDAIEDSVATLRFHGLASIAESGPLEPRLVDGEQTNTSVLYGERFVGKIVRKIDAGESADLEIGRFLTAVGFENTPSLAGWIDVEWPGDARSTVALLHSFVPNEGDAWAHVLRVLDAWLTAAEKNAGGPPMLPPADVLTRAMQPLSADVVNAVGPYAALATTLGRRVGEMHVALCSRPSEPAFAPEPLDKESRAAIVAAIHIDLMHALEGLGARGAALADDARMALSAVRSCVKELGAELECVAQREDGGVKMRVHGDLHLGQVLFTGTDFMLIDFEGEPARSIEERKAKRSPLVDVAGMLRSFHYASVSALRARPEESRAALVPWASLWHHAVAASFLRGWLAAVTETVVVPREPAAMRSLLELFLLEKCIYEVHYEMNNRPEWITIPLEGLRELLEVGRE